MARLWSESEEEMWHRKHLKVHSRRVIADNAFTLISYSRCRLQIWPFNEFRNHDEWEEII